MKGCEIGLSISFKDSMKKSEAKQVTATPSPVYLNDEMATFALDNISTQADVQISELPYSEKYEKYQTYNDPNFSVVDKNKRITVDASQINLTQEENSQYVPFKMFRYYDGVDLLTMTLLLYAVIPQSKDNVVRVAPVNVQYSDDTLYFGIIIPAAMVALKGTVQFEIQALGVNEKGDNYIFKTRRAEFNVEESLAGNGDVQPSQDTGWLTTFLNQVTEKVGEAQDAANQAQQSATEATNAANQATELVKTTKEELTASVAESISNALSDYYTKVEVDDLLKKIDLSDVYAKIDSIDGLAKFDVTYDSDTRKMVFYNGKDTIKEFILNSDPSPEWVTAYGNIVDGKISDATTPINTKIDEYKNVIDEDLSSIHEAIDGLPETLKSDYYDKTSVDNLLKGKASSSELTEIKFSITAVEQTANSNKTNITSLGQKVANLEDKMSNVNTEQLTYDLTYNEDNEVTFYEIKHEGESNEEKSEKAKFKITGGGGGGTSTILKIEYVTKSPLIVTTNDAAIIKYNFSGTDSSGDQVTEGNYTWKIGTRIIATGIATSGENTFDASDFISVGSQKLTLQISDDAGSMVTKTWTVQKIDIKIESSFNDKLTYPIGEVSFDYTPYGAISKDIHLLIDGKEQFKTTTNASGIPMAYSIPAQTHGAHLVEVYITALINGTTVESNHVKKDVIFFDSSSEVPVIGCVQTEFTAKQYDTTNITYTVYDPTTESPVVTLAIDGKEVSTLTLDSNTQVWQYKSSDVGVHTLTITCREIVKTLKATVEKININISPVTAGLVFDFNPTGKSNNDENRLFDNGDGIKMTVSDNFDWTNGGYQLDENGDQYFGIKAGSSATISYNMFEDDAKRNGKEFKLVFMTNNVRRADATFLTCLSGNIGLQMNVHEAYIKSSAKALYVPYSEEDLIEWDFNINKDTDIPIVMAYEDGTPGRPMSYTSEHNFTQETPVPISIGSQDCDVRIYRMKVYNTSLTAKAIQNNFIADARTATEMVDRYNRNQIYDENGMLTPESVANACPDLRVLMIEAPHFTNDKKDFVLNTSFECIYKNGDPILDNWKFTNAAHAGQGTSSNEYGAAGRNLDIICCFDGIHKVNSKITFDPNYKTTLTLGDGTKYEDGTGKISLTRTSVPTSWVNLKVNVASSDMVNNAYLQKRYNTYIPYSTPASRRDNKIKNAMEFVNGVIFVKESDPDITTHREFQDCEYHFYALCNMGDSKKTDASRAYDPDDMKEFCIEISDNTLPNSAFQTGFTTENGKTKYPISKSEWVEGNTAYDSLYTNWDGSFEFRYDCCGDSKDGTAISTDEEKEKIRTNNRQIWRDFYEFVITSTDDEFKNNLKNWCITDSILFFYLFTLRYTMIDNRAKNTFWHWAKHYISTTEATEMGEKAAYYVLDDEAAKINNGYRFDLWGYDFDTGLGINNSGELTMTYGKEDTDYRTDGVPSSGYVFNAAESVLFCRVRDLMVSQLRTMYAACESENCWSATSLINQFDAMQNELCEELWRVNYERVYERTYKNGNTRFLENMWNGKKKYQRRQFERDQEMYIATKFIGATATSDQIMFRCNTPLNAVVKPDYTLHLTPYSDLYLSVMFGNSSPIQVRAKAGQAYDISCPYSTMDDTVVLVYGASRIQSMGDVSKAYIHDNDFSKASKLKELIIGNTTSGYSNEFLTSLGIGNNTLLEKLDIQNTPNLAQSLDLSRCENLQELYAKGSGLTGVLFANGGKIHIAQLPATLTSINLRNLQYLTGLSIDGYDSIATLVMENCTSVDCKDILQKAKNATRIRLIGIDWDLDDTTLLDRLLSMKGLDKNGYNIDQSVVTGKVHVPVMREKKLADYSSAWPDLEVTYDTLVEQFTATFVNENGNVLDIQYVDKGGIPVDPITREDNPIEIPTKESTAEKDFFYDKWDKEFIQMFQDMKFTATYTSKIRQYTVRFLSKGVVLQEKTGNYGTTVFYDGDIPKYTAEESAYKYYLFKDWDSSGYITGNKDINAVYDSCEYVAGYFDSKDISTLRPVEIYTLMKMNLESTYVEAKDSISFKMGADYSFNDVEEKVLINTENVFTGKEKIDTGIQLFDVDRDFVLAVDYKFTQDNNARATLFQCYKSDGSLGLKVWHNSQPQLSWNTTTENIASLGSRDMIVIRHIKGENVLRVYKGDLPNDQITFVEMNSSKSTIISSTLVFGCSKADDGAYENYAKGTIYWAKLWYADLGDTACRNLAAWTHEKINAEMYGFKRYYLSDNSGSRSSMSFIADHTLSNEMMLHSISSNAGGWASMQLNKFLNKRFYDAIPVEWKQLIKQVKIPSSVGEKSQETSTSNCFIAIPSIVEIDGSFSSTEPYNYEGTYIPFTTSDLSRIRKTPDEVAVSYWLRSPNILYNTYTWSVNDDGSTNGYRFGNLAIHVVIIFSI